MDLGWGGGLAARRESKQSLLIPVGFGAMAAGVRDDAERGFP